MGQMEKNMKKQWSPTTIPAEVCQSAPTSKCQASLWTLARSRAAAGSSRTQVNQSVRALSQMEPKNWRCEGSCNTGHFGPSFENNSGFDPDAYGIPGHLPFRTSAPTLLPPDLACFKLPQVLPLTKRGRCNLRV